MGDQTLRGITLDLITIFPKIRPGGWVGGDDFSPSIWQHSVQFEPTLVFPFAVHFAEATGSEIFALPHRQFLLQKPARDATSAFRFVDLTGLYGCKDLLGELAPRGLFARMRSIILRNVRGRHPRSVV